MTQRVVNYTYSTGNPVLPNGSIDVRDGIDNLQSFDIFMNADEDTYNQRDGKIVGTISGANNRFNAQILNMGFTRIGTFAAGATLTNPRQTLLWDVSDGGDGQEYGWSGAFPKVVPAASTPTSTGGISVGAWISRFDPELRIHVREVQRRSYAEAGYNLVAGSFEAGGTLVNANDVLLQEITGKAFSGPAGNVTAGTNPASGGYIDRSHETLLSKVQPMLSSMRFVIGDGVTDKTSELKSALESGLTVHLAGDIIVSSEIYVDTSTVSIISNNANILYTGSAGSGRILHFRVTESFASSGIMNIDADNKAAYGLYVTTTTTTKKVMIHSVNTKDNLDSTTGSIGASGIFVANEGSGSLDQLVVNYCSVYGVNRSSASGACSGITATDAKIYDVSYNLVKGVYRGPGTSDADGIKVFNELTGTGVYKNGAGTIRANVISDCEGRFIKTQVSGVSEVAYNICSIDNPINLIPAWRAIDCQAADTSVHHNRCEFLAAFTGASDPTLIYMQVNGVPERVGQVIKQEAFSNEFEVATGATVFSTGIVFAADVRNLATRGFSVDVSFTDNMLTYGGRIDLATKACNIAFGMYFPSTWAAGASVNYRLKSNKVSANNFLYRLDGAVGDISSNLLLLEVVDNACPNSNNIPVVPFATGQSYTSNLLIKDNRVGLRGGEVLCPFDFSKLKIGCSFVLGGVTPSPAWVNAPTSVTFSNVSYSGPFIVIDRGGTLYKSNFSPATGSSISWSGYTL